MTLAYFYSRASEAHSETWTPGPAPQPTRPGFSRQWRAVRPVGYLGQTYGPSLCHPCTRYFPVEVELWGWIGANLTPLGALKRTFAPKVLLGCPYEDGCLNKPGYGDVTGELTIPAETKVRRREFYWLHDGSAGTGIWQLSRLPFPSAMISTRPACWPPARLTFAPGSTSPGYRPCDPLT